MDCSAELIIDSGAILGEGPIWHVRKQLLYWVNILENEVHIFDPTTREDRVIDVGQTVGTVVPRKSGGLMLALHHGFASLDLETEEVQVIHDPESHEPESRFNDGKCDPAGRFWAGTQAPRGRPNSGGLYCMDKDLSVRRMLENVNCSNGIVWSLDRTTMYYIDSPTREVSAFDYELETGNIANRRVVVRSPGDMGSLDGMTIDAEGMLWVAHWGGSCVSRWDPAAGKLLQRVSVPTSLVTACAFGGPDLDQLYITTARAGQARETPDDAPLAGGLFLARPGVRGIEAYEFAG